MELIRCEECGNSGMHGDGFQEIASGEDENGEFSELECLECGHLNRVYLSEEGEN